MGSVSSDTVVANSGQLTGTGTTGNLNVAAGGSISPGEALDPSGTVGTLTVDGDLNQASGSILAVKLSGSGADKLDVTGKAGIADGATLALLTNDPNPIELGTRYTLLSAAGGVDGRYTTAGLSDRPFLSFDLDHATQDISLDVSRSDVAFGDAADTKNQKAAAAALDRAATSDPVYLQVVNMSADEAPATFNSLSGEVYASTAGAMIEQSQYSRPLPWGACARRSEVRLRPMSRSCHCRQTTAICPPRSSKDRLAGARFRSAR